MQPTLRPQTVDMKSVSNFGAPLKNAALVLSILSASCSFDFGSLQGGDLGVGSGPSGDSGASDLGALDGPAAQPDTPAGITLDASAIQPDVPIAGPDGEATGGSSGKADAGVVGARDGQSDAPIGGVDGAAGGGGSPGTGGTGGAGGKTGTGGTATGGMASGGTSMGAGNVSAGGTTRNGGNTSTGGTTGSGGMIASGGSSGNGGTWGGTAPSCSGLAATCGPSGNDSCCRGFLVPSGTFARSYDGVEYPDSRYPATVSDFNLDKYEITVGRFRQFVNAGMGTNTNPPTTGSGAHPGITGSGWNSMWNANLPANTASLIAAVKCDATHQTWTDTAGLNESKPLNCLDWYTAFAFCAWDGGRLPTEAEWNYAASGGSEQRYYPWSSPPTSTTIDSSYAVYASPAAQNAGSKSPKGDGKWGHSDLTGNVSEWTLDWFESPYPMPCSDCANLTVGTNRVARGGGFYGTSNPLGLRSADRYYSGGAPGNRSGDIGARCARTGS